MRDKTYKGEQGFWKRNWLTIAVAGILFWVGWSYWWDLMRLSPFLTILHTLFSYLFILKLFYDNYSFCDSLFDGLRDRGWKMIRVMFRFGGSIWRKCAAGADLITQRLGVEQELVIAEKRKRKLEIELSLKRLQDELPDKDKSDSEIIVPMEKEKTEIIPPYAKYGPVLTDYLAQVRWEVFTVTQAQLVLRKRYGTVKLVLEELVEQRILEYVKLGKRIAYRLVETKNN